MTPSEEQKLAIEAGTDDSAFAQLYEHYLPRIYGYVYKRIGKKEEAEDITSNIFLKMVSNLGSFDAKAQNSSFKSWLYRIATNTIIDYYRTHKIIESFEKAENVTSKSATPSEEFEQHEKREFVFAALKSIPEKYQRVLYLKFYADLSNEEIAASLGITVNNLGVILHRSLKYFQKIYNKNLPYV